MPGKQSEKQSNEGAEPRELTARRADLLKRLHLESKAGAAPVQLVVRKLANLVASTTPGTPFQPKVYKEVADAFQKLLKAAKSAKKPLEVPGIVPEANQFMIDLNASLAERMEKAGFEVPENVKKKVAASKETSKGISRTLKDEMTSAPRRNTGEILGSADAPVQHGSGAPEKKVPEDLKKWVNPGLGRIGNK